MPLKNRKEPVGLDRSEPGEVGQEGGRERKEEFSRR